MNLATLKLKLISECKQYVELRMATAKAFMDNAQQAANEENKSSVGDKYETGRAMMQIEREKAAQQWHETLKLKHALDQLPLSAGDDKITLGSVVVTNSKKIFISIGIGKLTMDDEEFLVVAPASPLGKALLGLRKNDKLTFNKERITILEIG